jgi:aminoglycoside 6-adenylyltransferase
MFEHEIRLEVMSRFLGRRVEIDHDWSLPLPPFGRWVENLIAAETWSKIAATYVGADREDSWDALFGVIEVFRDVAIDIAEALGFGYPQALEDQMIRYLVEVRTLEPGPK